MKNAHMFFMKYDNNASRCVKNNCIIFWEASGEGRHLLCSPELEVWAEISYKDAWKIMKMNLDEVENKYKEETVLCECMCGSEFEIPFTRAENKKIFSCKNCGEVLAEFNFATGEVTLELAHEEDAVC